VFVVFGGVLGLRGVGGVGLRLCGGGGKKKKKNPLLGWGVGFVRGVAVFGPAFLLGVQLGGETDFEALACSGGVFW